MSESHESGLTLVELLVALTLLAILSVMLTGGLRFSARAWESSGSQLEDIERIQAVQRLLRRNLNSAQSSGRSARRRRATPANSEQEVFVGSPESVEFYAQLPRHHAQGGLYRIVIDGVAGGGNTNILRIRWRPRETGFPDIAGGETEEWTETILFADIEGIKFEYFGKSDKNEKRAWTNSWTDSRKLPGLVRLSVEFPEGDRRRWPALTVKLISAAP